MLKPDIKINKSNPRQIRGVKEIPGFKGYFATIDGDIISVKRKMKIIDGSPDKDGYLKITLSNDNEKPKYFRKHRLIALTFLGYSDLEINHKDGDKLNNKLSNLEYVTIRENQCHRRLKEGYFVGVCFDKKSKKWRAYIQENKKWLHLGFFDKKEDAKQAYLNKLNEMNIINKYKENN
jgi:hypothetical protein